MMSLIIPVHFSPFENVYIYKRWINSCLAIDDGGNPISFWRNKSFLVSISADIRFKPNRLSHMSDLVRMGSFKYTFVARCWS